MTTILKLSDTSGASQASILVDVGFNCFEFVTLAGGEQVSVLNAVSDFETGQVRGSSSGIPILFPFPNRIADGRYHWEGKDYQLPTRGEPGHAIHGFCFDRPWRIEARTENSATGFFQLSVDAPDRLPLWPADFIIKATYTVTPGTLTARYAIFNPDSRPLPYGFGLHPYFQLPLGKTGAPGQCTVQVPAAERWELKNFISTGERVPVADTFDLREPRSLAGLTFDDVWTNVTPSGDVIRCTVVDPEHARTLELTASAQFRELVVFTPPARAALCIEPYTCATDAVNLNARGIDAGWQTLPPGGSVEFAMQLSLLQD